MGELDDENWTEFTTLHSDEYRSSVSLGPGTARRVRITSMGDGLEGGHSHPIEIYAIQEAGYDVEM